MSDLYYLLHLSNGKNLSEGFFHQELKLKSRHPFPSPIKTEMYISLEDLFREAGVEVDSEDDHLFLEVIGYVDPVHGGYGMKDFHMLLRDRDDPKDLETWHPHAELIASYLKTQGWEER